MSGDGSVKSEVVFERFWPKSRKQNGLRMDGLLRLQPEHHYEAVDGINMREVESIRDFFLNPSKKAIPRYWGFLLSKCAKDELTVSTEEIAVAEPSKGVKVRDLEAGKIRLV